MNAVRKFTTFNELKACESKVVAHSSTMTKHDSFEKVITEFRAAKVLSVKRTKPKK